jgi:hypothetical protein
MCARKYGMCARKYGLLGHQTDDIQNDVILTYKVPRLHITAPFLWKKYFWFNLHVWCLCLTRKFWSLKLCMGCWNDYNAVDIRVELIVKASTHPRRFTGYLLFKWIHFVSITYVDMSKMLFEYIKIMGELGSQVFL